VGFVRFAGSVKIGVILNGVEVLPVAVAVLFAADIELGGRAERDLELEAMERRGKSRKRCRGRG
jgi:hypothetical protein